MNEDYGAYEIAVSIRELVRLTTAVPWKALDDYCGGGSTDGQFNITIDERRFSVHVSELEDE